MQGQKAQESTRINRERSESRRSNGAGGGLIMTITYSYPVAIVYLVDELQALDEFLVLTSFDQPLQVTSCA
jgi:hypothetical protein